MRLVIRRAGHDELDLAPAEPHVDRAGCEVAGDLGGRGRQRIEQHEPRGGVEAAREPLGDRARLLRAALHGIGELPLQIADVRAEIHRHHDDTTVVSCQAQVTPLWCPAQNGRMRMQEVAGEGILLAGGAAAILLQLADPRVAAGVAAHSDFTERPLDRLHGTLTYLYVIAYGTEEERRRIARQVGDAHRPVAGARDPSLQLWVAATLYWTAARIHDLALVAHRRGALSGLRHDRHRARHARRPVARRPLRIRGLLRLLSRCRGRRRPSDRG